MPRRKRHSNVHKHLRFGLLKSGDASGRDACLRHAARTRTASRSGFFLPCFPRSPLHRRTVLTRPYNLGQFISWCSLKCYVKWYKIKAKAKAPTPKQRERCLGVRWLESQ